MPNKKTRSNAPKETASASESAEPASQPVAPPLSDLASFTVPESMRGWVATAERCVREEPLKCAGVVAAVGVVGSILPLGRIIGSLVRPVLMIAGLVKVLEEVERRRKS